MPYLLRTIALGLACLCCNFTASAQAVGGRAPLDLKKPKPEKKRNTTISRNALRKMLFEGNQTTVQQAFKEIATNKPGTGAALIAERVRQGLPKSLLKDALETLLALKSRSQTALLTELARHRDPEIRLQSLGLLVELKANSRRTVLLEGLSDSDSSVREQSATLLLNPVSRQAIPKLIKAYQLGVKSAEPVWRFTSATDVKNHLIAKLPTEPLDTLARPIEISLLQEKLPLKTKTDIVTTLAKLKTPESVIFLRELYVKLANKTPEALRTHIQQVLRAMDNPAPKDELPSVKSPVKSEVKKPQKEHKP